MAEDVMGRDNDVDRLHLLIARQSNMILRDMTLARKMGVSLEDAIHHYLISRMLERVGDHAVRIESNVIGLIEDQRALDKKLVGKISSASDNALELLNTSVESLLEKDMEMAHGNIEKVQEIYALCEAIEDYKSKKEGHKSITLSYIAESIRRTAEYSGDISEVVMNNLIQYQ
jgi:phosphate uptake regulator